MTGSTRLTSEVNKINVYLNFRGCPCFLLMIQTLRVTQQQLLKTFETDKKKHIISLIFLKEKDFCNLYFTYDLRLCEANQEASV